MRAWLILALGMASALGVRRASAVELANAELTVARAPGAEGCPDETGLARSVAALGAAEESPRPTMGPLTVTVTFGADTSGYTAQIRSTGRKEGLRELAMPGPSCAELAEATSVAVAVLLDLLASPDEPSPPPPEPTPERAPKRVSREPRPRQREMALLAGVAGGASYNLMGPKPWPLLAGRLALSNARFELAGGGFWSLPSRFSVGPGTVDVSLAVLRLEGCVWFQPASNAGPGGCAGVVGGWLSGEGTGFDDNDAVTRPYFATSASFAWRLALGQRGSLRIALSALVPWHEESFTVAPSATAYTTEPISALIEIGPELRIW